MFRPALEAELAECLHDPDRFNETVLCRSPYWPRQREICESVVRYPVTCVVTGNGIGKSFVDAGILAWFACLHPGSKCVVAAPTNAQLSGVLWAEFRSACKSADDNGRPLGGRFQGLTYTFAPGWGIEGFGQGSVEAKSGRHAEHLLALVDEASGVHPSVHEAIDSLNPSRRLYTGNPIKPEGKFYDLVQAAKTSPNINVIHISSLESPHADLPRSPWGMADGNWLETSRHEYGEDSLWWTVHVLGKFPDELFQALLPIPWLAQAAEVYRNVDIDDGPRRMGIDVAIGRDGDNASIVVRDDGGVIFSEQSNKWGLEALAKRAKLAAVQHRVHPSRIVYDATGVGVDFGNRLAAEGLEGCRDFMGSRDGGEKYSNLRSASSWVLRRRLDPNRSKRNDPAGAYLTQKPFHLPRHLLQLHRRELQECRYQLDNKGRIQLEPKDQFQARLKHSPNFLDSLLMTFAFPFA